MASRNVFYGLLLGLTLCWGCASDPEIAKQQYLESGNVYFQQHKYDAAAIQYRNAVKLDARFGEARYRLSQTYRRMEDVPNALREAARAADLLPDRVDVQLHAAGLLLIAGRFEDVRSRAQQVLKQEPHNVQAQIALGASMAGLKDLQGAIAQMEEAIRLDPGQSHPYLNLGALHAAKGDTQDAEKFFLDAINHDEKSVLARLTLGQFYWQGGRLDDAERTLKEALSVAPTEEITNRLLAVFYQSRNRHAEAEQYLKAAIAVGNSAAGRMTLADYYVSQDRMPEAIRIFESLASDSTLGSLARIRRATLHHRAGEFDLAEQVIESVLAKDPQHIEALLVKADYLLVRKDSAKALQAVDAAIAADRRSPRAYFVRGRLLAAINRPEEAKRAFSEVLKLNPRASIAQVELARLHLGSGAVDTSMSLAGEAAATAPQSVDARILLARGLLIRRDLVQAEAMLTSLVAAVPNSAVVHTQMGLLLTLKKQPKAAAAAFEHALSLDPSHLEALGGLVGLDLVAGRVAEARARIEARLTVAARDTGLLMLAARTFIATKDSERAETILRQALVLDPALLPAYSMLGQVYFKQNRLDDARREFEQLATRQSSPTSPLTMVGIIQQMQQRPAEARQTFERVLQLDSRSAVAANNLAWIYAESGDNSDVALQLAQTAKAGLPDMPEVSDTLGWIYYRKGLLPQGIRALKDSVALRPTNPTFQFHLGLAYARNGDNVQARHALETALKLDPTFHGAAEASSTLASLRASGDVADVGTK
jgi:tetratricopeptide (TPR) repeat protein